MRRSARRSQRSSRPCGSRPTRCPSTPTRRTPRRASNRSANRCQPAPITADLAGMMNTRLRPVGLATLAALTLGGLAGDAAAHPRNGDPARPSEPELNYIYFHDGDRVSMSGDMRDIERARRFRQGNELLLWFRDAGQEFVLRDPGLLKQIDVLWKPVEELGEAQGKLGSQQGELGRQMGELGAQQGLLGTRQGALSVREASLSMRENSDSL